MSGKHVMSAGTEACIKAADNARKNGVPPDQRPYVRTRKCKDGGTQLLCFGTDRSGPHASQCSQKEIKEQKVSQPKMPRGRPAKGPSPECREYMRKMAEIVARNPSPANIKKLKAAYHEMTKPQRAACGQVLRREGGGIREMTKGMREEYKNYYKKAASPAQLAALARGRAALAARRAARRAPAVPPRPVYVRKALPPVPVRRRPKAVRQRSDEAVRGKRRKQRLSAEEFNVSPVF